MPNLLYEILFRPWSNLWYIGNTLDSAFLLSTAALGLVLAFKAGSFNLAGESQIYMGGILTTIILLYLPLSLPRPLLISLALVLALGSGAASGALTGVLKTQAGADPMISSFLISTILSPIGDWLITGPLRDRTKDLLASPRIPQDLRLLPILPPSSLHIGILLLPLLICAIYLFLDKSFAGLRLRVLGRELPFARYAGIKENSYLTGSLAAGGALHGLAGFFIVAGTAGICHLGFPAGLGWNAIAVALIAQNRALLVFPAALFFAWLEAGTQAAVLATGINLSTKYFIVAIIFFGVSAKKIRKKP